MLLQRSSSDPGEWERAKRVDAVPSASRECGMGAKKAGRMLWEGHHAPHRDDWIWDAFNFSPGISRDEKGKRTVISRDREF